MDFKKKMKTRLYTAIIYIVLGVMMNIGVAVVKSDNDFISGFGFALIIMGIVRIRNYWLITKNDETIRKRQITETDERNVLIMYKARSMTFSIYFFLLGIAVIVLSLLSMHDAAKWIESSVGLLAVIYWICYWVYQKKL